ncbi:hypothetical protein NONO_c09860 [Nocardia nova SH22a]|uniref:Uncharacterized protein n=1 Tax=Nocardia nova SH22a TaxID=1415166 RepID=W5T9W0_9NOCA|nr:hypothetical protein [Nocardia nova]AHH15793.1 hypothetical protein NONO_c09860 [Nocardia nova SH22a]
MAVTARIGAIHLGWDVVSVAAGGGGTPIRPVQVEGTYTPPAYLLADKSGRLHTAGADRQRPDLGIAISDVRDILGHQQIRVAGATWPAELVFRARLYNPLAAIGTRLRGKPDVIALPFPDDWADEKVEEYCRLIEQMGVDTDPLPESVALSGYVRALGLVSPPERGRRGVGATGVYSDGRVCLVVAVDGDDEQPTESVGVPISADAIRDAHSADNVVIEVMAAARSIGADTSTVLLTGNVCFNDALRLAFQNHLGHRLRVADHPMHALVLGAAHLLVTDSEYAEADPAPEPPRAAPPEDAGRHAWRGGDTGSTPVDPRSQQPPARPPEGRHAARGGPPGSGPQPMVPGDQPGDQGSRFTRPPDRPVDEQRTTVLGRPGEPSAGTHGEDENKGKGWGRLKDNLFGAPAIAGAVALAAIGVYAEASDGLGDAGTAPVVTVARAVAPDTQASDDAPQCAMTANTGWSGPAAQPASGCARLTIDDLRYLVPDVPGAIDSGPPVHI